MLSIEDAPPQMGLHITSDLAEPWSGTVRWSLETLAGGVLESGEEAVSVEPLCSTHLATLDFTDQLSDDNRREVIFIAELWQANQRLALNVGTFVANKHLALSEPALAAELRHQAVGQQLVVELTARSLARFVELSLDRADVVFSDNYFDLPARRTPKQSAHWYREVIAQNGVQE